jgi:hypothetical protein
LGNKFGTVSHSTDGTYHSKVSNMYQGIFRNNLIVRDNYNRVSQSMLTKVQGSGGRLLLYDNTGAPKADIRGYVSLGTQAYFALGGVAIGADQVSSTEMLYVVGDSKITGQVLLPNIATTAGGAGSERLYWDSSASCVKWG